MVFAPTFDITDPVLLEITRGDRVESRHRGAFAISDPAGALVASAGDVDQPVFPRSAVKLLQALPLVETGWADRLQLTDADLALLCSSHRGEPIHVETARAILAKAGRHETDLECGVHWPTSKSAARRLALDGQRPSALHNNCSGKHAGFLCLACALDAESRGYVAAGHPVQARVKSVLQEVYDSPLEASPGIDGCSIPTYPVPLRALAQAFARIASGEGLDPVRRDAAARLRAAVARHPVLVGGSDSLDTKLAAQFGERLYTKTGAEGVFCAAFPERGWGLALKCDDGATRGSEAMLTHLIEACMTMSDGDHAAVRDLASPVLRNWNGIEVGRIRATPALPSSLPGR